MNRAYLAAGVLDVGLMVGMSSAYSVGEAEQVIITQFGDPSTTPILDTNSDFLKYLQRPR